MFIFIPTHPDAKDFATFAPNLGEGLPIWAPKNPTRRDGGNFLEKKRFIIFLYLRSSKSDFFRVCCS
tara:strand:+ start:309 stop:509 length:201 start_codon:yes stop_codon:yes gene_type:complete